MLKLVCIGVLYLSLGYHAEGNWCYEREECEPNTWPQNYPTCGNSSQSPINIINSEVQLDNKLQRIHIFGWSLPSTGVVTNNGHTVEVVLSSDYFLAGAGLPNIYKFSGFHLHFGSLLAGEGSEHQIDGQAYPLEVHFVFYNTKYVDLATAKTKPDGLAVVGVLFEIGERHGELQNVVNVLSDVAYQGQSATISIRLSKLLLHTENFYKYQGSLTTPPCSENVAWHVIRIPQQLSSEQYEAIVSSLYFTSSTAVEKIPMVNNFRPVQPLNGRIVYRK
ncbi:carbonic anhydrase 12-like [Bufo gargarizans]|uniref:carbonic anhydrase 12-like n=1 Tax=Bufo gargarizans TaxID=30331 RepID=UPI001CF0EAAF|nr:carbonic anhydrase 12-like [Bufo gargarizans]